MHDKRTKDRRTQKTEALLREALGALIREKPYDDIVVKEILARADVGRSTFYAHFHDKDELLLSGIQDMLRSAQSREGIVSSERGCTAAASRRATFHQIYWFAGSPRHSCWF